MASFKKRRRVRRIREMHPIFEAKAPNEIWSVDFKGKLPMILQERVTLLMLLDTFIQEASVRHIRSLHTLYKDVELEACLSPKSERTTIHFGPTHSIPLQTDS